MSLFKRRQQPDMPRLNTAALPDLIFTVLFFFMMVTHMRHVEVKVNVDTPQGRNLEKVAKRSSVITMFVTADDKIQVNNDIVPLDEVGKYVSSERNKMLPETVRKMVVNIKADRNVRMETMNSIRRQLRSINALNVIYVATEEK